MSTLVLKEKSECLTIIAVTTIYQKVSGKKLSELYPFLLRNVNELLICCPHWCILIIVLFTEISVNSVFQIWDILGFNNVTKGKYALSWQALYFMDFNS